MFWIKSCSSTVMLDAFTNGSYLQVSAVNIGPFLPDSCICSLVVFSLLVFVLAFSSEMTAISCKSPLRLPKTRSWQLCIIWFILYYTTTRPPCLHASYLCLFVYRNYYVSRYNETVIQPQGLEGHCWHLCWSEQRQSMLSLIEIDNLWLLEEGPSSRFLSGMKNLTNVFW